ncbi:MAG: ABC transporter permease [Promethearchaeota archaeon]
MDKKHSHSRKKGQWLTPISITMLCGMGLVAFFIIFFYIPLGRVFHFAFANNSGMTPHSWKEVLGYSLNLRAIQFSALEAIITTVLCLILGIPIGIFLGNYNFKGRSTFLQLLTIPFVLPPIVVLLGFVIVYGDGGWINTLWNNFSGGSQGLISIYGTYTGIILAHVFYNLSVVIQFTIPAWQRLNREQKDVALSLGASHWRIFWRIQFPQMKSAILAAALLVFLYSFNSFAIVLYLGNVQLQTLEVRIYKLILVAFDYQSGAILALLQLFLNIFLIFAYLRLNRSTQNQNSGPIAQFVYKKIPWYGAHDVKRSFGFILVVIGFMIIVVFQLLPLIAVVITAFTPNNENSKPFSGFLLLFNSNYDPLLGASILRLIGNTILFAFTAMLVTLLFTLGILLIYRRRYHTISQYKNSSLDSIFAFFIILPMATSSITLALGLFLQYKSTILYLQSPWILIIGAHILLGIPFATRTVIHAYQQIDPELIHVASTLGASNWVIFKKIEFPLIKPGLFVGALFSFAISIGEFGATYFLARGEFGTISIAISKLLSTRNMQLPASMATLLILLTLISFLLIQKIGNKTLLNKRKHLLKRDNIY